MEEKEGIRKKFVEEYPKIIKMITGATVILLPLIYIPGFTKLLYLSDGYNWPKAQFLQSMMLLAFLVFIIGIIFEIIEYKKVKSIDIRFDINTVLISIMVLMMILSTVFSKYQDIVYVGHIKRYEGLWSLLSYMAILLFGSLYFKRNDTIKVIKMLLYVSIPLSIYGILQFYNIQLLPLTFDAYDKSAVSTFANRNFSGSYAVMMLFLSMGLVLHTKKKIYYVTSGLLYMFLLATITRGSWLGGIVAFIVFSAVFHKILIKNYKKLVLLIIIFAIATFVLSFNDIFDSRIDTVKNEFEKLQSDDGQVISSVGSDRLIIYVLCLELLPDNMILGSGPETLIKRVDNQTFNAYKNTEKTMYIDKAHNEFLHYWITLGFIFLLAYLALLIKNLYKSVHIIKKDNDLLSLSIFLAVLAYILQANFNISVISVGPIYWFLLSQLLVMNKEKVE